MQNNTNTLENKVLSVSIYIPDFLEEYKELQLLADDDQKSSIIELLKERFKGAEKLQEISIENNYAMIKWHYNKTIHEADTLNQAAIRAIKAKDHELAIKSWLRAIEINPIEPDYYYNIGLAYLAVNKSDKCIDSCLEAIRICPVYFRAYLLLGSLFSRQKNFEKAEDFMRNGLLLDRKNVHALINLGALYSMIKKFDEAIKCFDRVIQLSTKEIKAYLGLGKIYHIKKDYDNALRNFKVVAKLDPDGPMGVKAAEQIVKLTAEIDRTDTRQSFQAQPNDEITEEEIVPEHVNTLYAEGYQHFIDGEFVEAITNYQGYLRYNKNDADVWASLASCQARIGRMTEAIESIDKALALESDNIPMFYKQAAIIYDTCEKYKEAGDSARKAFELGKQDSTVLSLIGKSLVNLEKFNEGLSFLEDAVKLNPNNLTARYNLGLVLKNLGQNDKALENFEEIIWSKYKSPLKNEARKAMQEMIG